MNVNPTGIDMVASIFVLIIVVISGFTLLGTGVLMAIGAVFSKRPLVTSWPQAQEQAFSPFERRGESASSLAWVFSLLGGALITVIAMVIYFGVTPDRRDVSRDMNMSNLTKRRPAAAPAPRPDAPPSAEAGKPDTAAPAAADTPKPAPVPAEAPKQ